MSSRSTVQNPKPRSDRSLAQKGFVSIIVAALLMIILALITVGFTRLMQREQRQAIDRQLSRQALYAAEAGINDVAAAIAASTAGYTDPSKTDCDPSALPSSNLSGDGTVAVTCALYDEAPGSLDYDVAVDGSKIVQLRTASGNDFNSVTVAWGNSNPANNNIASPPLPPCGAAPATLASYPATRPAVVPILRFDLTSIVGGAYDRTSLIQNTDYLYLIPCDGGGVGSHDFAASTTRGDVVEVPCSGAGAQPCSVDITGLAPVSNTFFARIRPVYDNAAVTLSATETTGAGVVPVQFDGAQVGIDVTAKAGDVVRRLRASVPFSTSVDVPEAALQAFDGICKQLDIINDATPGALIADNCFAPPPQIEICDPLGGGGTIFIPLASYDPLVHTLPPCGGGPGPCPSAPAGLSIDFDLSSIALAAAGGPGNEVAAAFMIDALYIPTAVIGTPDYDLRWSFPDLDLGAETGVADFRVDVNCQYFVDYTNFCLAPTNLANPWGSPPNDPCSVTQLNEGLRVSFHSASSIDASGNNQCDRSPAATLAYFDVPDHYVGASPPTSATVNNVPVVNPNGNSGTIRCMEVTAACVIGAGHIGCPDPFSLARSSSFMHFMRWIEQP